MPLCMTPTATNDGSGPPWRGREKDKMRTPPQSVDVAHTSVKQFRDAWVKKKNAISVAKSDAEIVDDAPKP